MARTLLGVSTDHESPPLDAEDWNIVFQAYSDYPILAFILAQHLHSIKELVQSSPENRTEAIAGLDRAIESLMPHTNFRDAGRKVLAGSRGRAFTRAGRDD